MRISASQRYNHGRTGDFLDRIIRRACLIGSLSAAMLAGTASLAATTDTDSDTDSEGAPELQEVVVTGSLLARPNAETAEAITIVSADDLKNEGVTTVEQALTLVSANQTSSYQTASAVTVFTGGGAFASLRGLGATKTLVLLDGQRLASNVVLGTGIDLDTIPFSAIDRIEVLREGASSLYGTDAIGGVINFITKKDYDKGELDITGTKPQDGGGGGTSANLSYGHGNVGTDGYNLLVTGNYTYGAELRATQRPFSSTGFDPARGLANTNNPGTWPGSYEDANSNEYQVGYPGCLGNPYLTRYYGNCAYEYSAAVDLIPKTTKESFLVAFTKTLPADNTVGIQYFYARSQVTSWTGPQEYGAYLNPGSPYFPTAANSTCVGTCSGPPDLTAPIEAIWTDPANSRDYQDTNVEQRILLTFDGKNSGWDYSTAFNFSLNHTRFDLQTGFPNDSILEPGGVLNPLVNPFGPQSAAGQAFIDSTYESGEVAVGTYRQWSFNGHASHELGDAFGAGRAAAFAVGFDVRGEHIGYTTTPLAAALSTQSYFTPTYTLGSRTEQAVYAEMNVPLTKEFDFTISDREDRYSDFGDTNNGKISFRYQPFEMLTFRAAASTGFRAPSLFELYRPATFGATGFMDSYPGCATGNYTAIFTQSNCDAQGLALYGGNANLKPETSDNFDVGFIVEPIKDLGITVDWYRITIKDEIQTVPDTAIYGNPTTFANYYVLNNAGTLTQAPSAPLACNPYTSPTCGYIYQNSQNTGGIATDGLDMSAQYLIRTPIGKIKASLEGTLVTKFLLQQYLNGPQLNLVGQFNEGNEPIIRWSHQLNVDWTNGPFGAGINNHFLSSYGDYALLANGQVHTVGDYSIWGIYGSWKPVDPMTVLLGVSNVFNTDPPFSNNTAGGSVPVFQGGYNPLFSDPTGRAFYVRLKYQFL
jgi:iron complex outermembrane receptor protein